MCPRGSQSARRVCTGSSRVKRRGRVERREQGWVKRREGAQSVKDAHLEEEEAHRVVDVGVQGLSVVQGHSVIEVGVHACAHMRTHLRPQALAQTWARYRKASLRPCA